MDPRDRTKQIGRRIRAARKAEGLSQVELARLLPGTLSDNSISGWENGRHRPSAAHLEALAHALDRPVAYFYGNDG